MGSTTSRRNGQCCANNQSVDREQLHSNLTTHRAARIHLYHDSGSSSEGEEGYERPDPIPQPAPTLDPEELKWRAQILESFKTSVQEGNTSLVQYFFNEYPDIDFAKTYWRNGDTALHVAVRNKHTKLIRMLIDDGQTYYGININAQNSVNGDTVLHTAVRDVKDANIVRLLIEAKVDPNTMNYRFHSAMHSAMDKEINDIMSLLPQPVLDPDSPAPDPPKHLAVPSDVTPAATAAIRRFNAVHLGTDSIDRMGDNKIENHINHILSESQDSGVPLHESMDMAVLKRQVTEVLLQKNPESESEETEYAQTPSPISPLSPGSDDDDDDGQEFQDFGKMEFANTIKYNKLSLEDKMDEESKVKLKRVSLKNKNPFSKLRVTKQDNQDVRELLSYLEQLPELDGYLTKQVSEKIGAMNQKKWVHVTEEWVLWNDKSIALEYAEDGKISLEQRKQFDGVIQLHHIDEVGRTGKSGKKFMFKARYQVNYEMHHKTVVWKCHDRREREYWVNGLTQYVAFCKKCHVVVSVMGDSLSSKCGSQCCTNQAVDRDNLTTNLTTHRAARTTLYHSSGDSSDEGEGSYSEEDSEPAVAEMDHEELALRAQVLESFKGAIQSGNTSLVSYLFNEHPNLELARTKWRNGDTALHVAVRNKSEDLIRMLLTDGLDHGIKINEQNTINGDTALHTAVRDIQNPDMVRLLIGFDIDPNIMNRQFHTPLRIAVEQRSYSIMDLLSKYSLDLDVAARESSVSDESDHERVGSMTEHAVLRQAVSILNVGSPHLLSYPGSRSQSPRSQSPRSRSASCRSASGYLSEEEYGKLTMEEKMDEDAKHTITKVNLKNKNPFSKVRVTKQEGRGVKELMRDLEQLPELDGFLLKQTSKPPYSYRKRWVHVTEEWVLWNDRQIGIDFTNDQAPTLEDRQKCNGAVHLKNVVAVTRTGKSGKKFIVKVQYKKEDKLHYRKMLWKCPNEREREYWLNGLSQYVKYCKEMIKLYSQ